MNKKDKRIKMAVNKKRVIICIAAICLVALLTGCCRTNESEGSIHQPESVTIYVDAAASLKTSLEEIITLYNEMQPNVTISLNTGSSGTLLTQIEESDGIDHDVFFSAGIKQIEVLDEEDYLMVENSRVDMLSNQLCLVKAKGIQTNVTGWESMSEAKNIALCDCTVPVGRYSRKAFVSLGLIPKHDENYQYTTMECSEALGGIEINECSDANAAAQAVAEGSNEIGIIYYSDYYDFIDDLEIIAQDDGTLTGKIIYPVCQIVNSNATKLQNKAAKDFITFLQSEESLQIFEKHCLIVNR